ncbi:type VI secretion system lipoprotein TssJ [Vibrio sinensis]|uniref:Type VI secretion system lipoprotein TssJ n=1 Tax=Vibrio sinensis TaxID=2302434 RepID=A0A3A6QTG0_9VIBR|nr:type VI secretion system lipoprotein TssJ [Vibrio sinensis]RJX75653.1 type VI secretion system lipoprotein TssJ [Vibrio sinensis]
MNIRSFALLILLVTITACSSSESYQPAEQPTKVTFSLVSDDGTNPNIWGEAAPIAVQVFELVDDSMFMSADYDQMKDDYEGELRSNFIKNYDYVLTPGQFKFVNAFEIDEETNYIGVMAHFSEPDLSEWKKAVKVLNKGREYHLLMYFKDYDVKLERVE